MADRFVPALAPHEYVLVWRLALDGPLTGGELATSAFVHQRNWTPAVTGTKLAAIARHTGLVERVDGIWRLTDRGRDWLGEGRG